MDFNEFARTLPDWARIGIMGAGYGIGFKLGWTLLDRYLERRRERRERGMRNITPA